MDALGDATRRGIFEGLREGPRAVGELAAGLPVSRPAVSQHLRILKEAGLVHNRKVGTRQLYEVDVNGLDEVREWLDGFWTDALIRFKEAAEQKARKNMSDVATIAPVTKSIQVGATVEDAFRVFTTEMGSWWPTESYSIAERKVDRVVFEEREDGEVYEVSIDGAKSHWATVIAWEPPTRVVISWEVNPDNPATEIEVRFTATDGGTQVALEHRRWERLGAAGPDTRNGYDNGWNEVLGRYGATFD